MPNVHMFNSMLEYMFNSIQFILARRGDVDEARRSDAKGGEAKRN